MIYTFNSVYLLAILICLLTLLPKTFFSYAQNYKFMSLLKWLGQVV